MDSGTRLPGFEAYLFHWLTIGIISGKLYNISVLQFPYLWGGDNNSAYFMRIKCNAFEEEEEKKRMAKIKKAGKTKCWHKCRVITTSIYFAGESVNLFNHCAKRIIWQSLLKLNAGLSYAPENPFLGLYPRKLSKYVHQSSRSKIFLLALIMLVPN
jgi:hypothetical protein